MLRQLHYLHKFTIHEANDLTVWPEGVTSKSRVGCVAIRGRPTTAHIWSSNSISEAFSNGINLLLRQCYSKLCWRVESMLLFLFHSHFKHLCMPNLRQPHFVSLHMQETTTKSDFYHVTIVVVTKWSAVAVWLRFSLKKTWCGTKEDSMLFF